MFKRYQLHWNVGHTRNPDDTAVERVPAMVPGAVQLDWARAKGWGDFFFGDNWWRYLWMEDEFWSYVSRLDLPCVEEGHRLIFVCRGVDYRFLVRLNGVELYRSEGMFTPFEIDLTGRAVTGDRLEVLVYPAPKSMPTPSDLTTGEESGQDVPYSKLRFFRINGRDQANQSCKPAVSYGWDFHPRLIPLGIWDETYLELRPSCHMRDVETRYTLADDLSTAEVGVEIRLSEAGPGTLRWRMLNPRGQVCLESEASASQSPLTLRAKLDAPALWWPNGQGDAALYLSRVELCDHQGLVVQRVDAMVGFRTVRLVTHPATWVEPSEFPKSRSVPPITLEVNGRRIFCKGSNWVNPHVFPGVITEDTYRHLLELVKNANMNLLRCWGGAIVNKESFFELCDRMGIMVWQEFPLACARYEGTPDYLKVLNQESCSIIHRLRRHPCVAIWCGGNELFNGWSKMTDQDLAIRLLNRNCYDLDPSRPFLPTSPVMGMGHGHYLFRDAQGLEVFQIQSQSKCTAYTEFGCPGPSSAEDLRKIIPEQDLFPPRAGTAWETHHAFNAWVEGSWLQKEVMEDYFGPSGSLEQFVEHGQRLQAEGYKCIFEEARRQKPTCSMALNWCFNEPWPSAVNNNLISWPSTPKPAYVAVAASCRPVLASARIPKFRWKAGETFSVELGMLSDLPEKTEGGPMEAWLRIGQQEEQLLLRWEVPSLEANVNIAGPIVRYVLPPVAAREMVLSLRMPDNPDRDSQYTLMYVPAVANNDNQRAVLNL